MISFTLPRRSLPRLSRVHLACADEMGPIGHISLRLTQSVARVVTTDGMILASLVVPVEGCTTGSTVDLILDRVQFVVAITIMVRTKCGAISVGIEGKELRLTCGTSSAIVRIVDGTYPDINGLLDRHAAAPAWVPSVCSLDPKRMAIAQKIIGKIIALFNSPTHAPPLGLVWDFPCVDNLGHEPDIAVSSLRDITRVPAFWADHEMCIMIMPITRSSTIPHPALSVHAILAPDKGI